MPKRGCSSGTSRVRSNTKPSFCPGEDREMVCETFPRRFFVSHPCFSFTYAMGRPRANVRSFANRAEGRGKSGVCEEWTPEPLDSSMKSIRCKGSFGVFSQTGASAKTLGGFARPQTGRKCSNAKDFLNPARTLGGKKRSRWPRFAKLSALRTPCRHPFGVAEVTRCTAQRQKIVAFCTSLKAL